MNILSKLLNAFWHSTKRFFSEKYTYHASALSFTTLLAMVPLVAISVFFMTLFPFFSNAIELSENYILKNFIPSAAGAMQSYIQDFIHQAASLPSLNILFLFITAILMVNTIDETLNEIWKTKRKQKKLTIWVFYWIIVLVAPIIIGVSVFLMNFLFSTDWIVRLSFLLVLLPISINALLIGLIYITVPNVKVRYAEGFLGGLVAAILIEFARVGFTFYIEKFSGYGSIYGAFAMLPIFLIWIYIWWSIILWGAVFTQIISTR